MPLTVQALNLVKDYPIQDNFHAGNTGGIIRFIDVRDAIKLGPMQRLQGDIVHRFILVEDTINGLIEFLNANPLVTGLDDSVYTRVDGSRDFTQPIKGVTPTDAAHLATKGYVDTGLNTVNNGSNAVAQALQAYKEITPYTFESAWTEYTWQGGRKVIVNATVLPTGPGAFKPDYDKLTGIRILERLDIAQPSTAVPNPPAEYVYRDRTASNKSFAIDDFWVIPGTDTVRILVPNFSGFDSGYTNSGYELLQSPRKRWLKVVVTAPKA